LSWHLVARAVLAARGEGSERLSVLAAFAVSPLVGRVCRTGARIITLRARTRKTSSHLDQRGRSLAHLPPSLPPRPLELHRSAPLPLPLSACLPRLRHQSSSAGAQTRPRGGAPPRPRRRACRAARPARGVEVEREAGEGRCDRAAGRRRRAVEEGERARRRRERRAREREVEEGAAAGRKRRTRRAVAAAAASLALLSRAASRCAVAVEAALAAPSRRRARTRRSRPGWRARRSGCGSSSPALSPAGCVRVRVRESGLSEMPSRKRERGTH